MPDENRVIPFVRPKPAAPQKPALKATPPIFNVPNVVLASIVVLLAIHACLWLLGQDWQIWSLYALSFIPARLLDGVVAAPIGASIWTFLTYGFLHGDWTHVMFNSLWLLIFATPVARRLGAVGTVLCMAISTVAGAAAMLPLNWGDTIIIVGASAAVSGMMAAAMPIMYSPYFDRTANNLDYLRPVPFAELIRDTRAIGFTALFFAMQLFTGAAQANSSTAFLSESSIAWEAHVGGFIMGLFAFYYLDRRRIPSR